MEIKKLLFVTKFEELGFDALQSLLTLTNAALDHVVFVNVIERDRVAMRRGVGYHKEEEIRLRETANIRFIDWAEELYEREALQAKLAAFYRSIDQFFGDRIVHIDGEGTAQEVAKQAVDAVREIL